TFWPLSEVARDAAEIAADDPPEAARARLNACVAGAEAAAIVDRVAAAIGLSRETFPIEELFWGARKLLSALARERPRVVVCDSGSSSRPRAIPSLPSTSWRC